MAITDEQRKALQDEAYEAGAADFAGTSEPYIHWLEEQLLAARAESLDLQHIERQVTAFRSTLLRVKELLR